MKFANNNLKPILKHNRPILTINRFENNDDDHYYSLSDNSEMKNWLIDSNGAFQEELETYYLLRPKEQFLVQRGHLATKLTQSSKYFKITYTISFKQFIINGYEDGLLLVWKQEKRDIIDKNRLIKFNSQTELIVKEARELINEGENAKQYEPDYLEDDPIANYNIEAEALNTSLEQYMKQPEEPTLKDYFNIMWLHFILIGHTQAIINLLPIPEKNMLISSSEDLTINFYDLASGRTLYHIDLQTEARFIVYINIPKPKLEKIILLASPNNKIDIKLNPDSLGINTSTINFLDLKKVVFFNKKFYLVQSHTHLLIYTMDFKLEKEIPYPAFESFIDLIIYNQYFIFFSSDKKLHLCEMINDKLVRLFSMVIGQKTVSNIMLIDSLLYMTNLDGNIYTLDIEGELMLYWNRKTMMEEEKVSVAFNKFLMSKKAKKKRGKSGKRKGVNSSVKRTRPSKSPPKKKILPPLQKKKLNK